jgi:RNA polymerase sigma-70 factor (ECF subfamily)
MPPRSDVAERGCSPVWREIVVIDGRAGWIDAGLLRQAASADHSRSAPRVVTEPSPEQPDQVSDAALVRAVAAGDRPALAMLYDRYASLVMAVGVRILRNRRDAEDIAHDVFLEVWRRAGTYDPAKASVRTWLVLIMRCRALDRRKSAPVSMTSALIEDVRTSDPSESPDAKLERARVTSALGALTTAQREVLVLGYYEGLSSSEIAERLGIPLGTVKSRVAGALRALRGRLGDDEGVDPPEEPT